MNFKNIRLKFQRNRINQNKLIVSLINEMRKHFHSVYAFYVE